MSTPTKKELQKQIKQYRAEIKKLRPHVQYDQSVWNEIQFYAEKVNELQTKLRQMEEV